MNRLASLVAVAIAGSAFCTLPALAAEVGDTLANETMDVTLTVDPSCEVTVTDLSFGTITSLASDVTEENGSAGNIAVTCTNNTKYEVGLGTGLNSGQASTTTRSLLNDNSADHPNLDYDLYSANTRMTAWGETQGGSGNTVAVTSDDEAHDIPVYGKVTAGQPVSVGTYSDTVAVTVWYEGEGDPV